MNEYELKKINYDRFIKIDKEFSFIRIVFSEDCAKAGDVVK